MLPPRAHTRWWGERSQFLFLFQRDKYFRTFKPFLQNNPCFEKGNETSTFETVNSTGWQFHPSQTSALFSFSQMKLTMDLKVTWRCNPLSLYEWPRWQGCTVTVTKGHTSVTRGHNILESAPSCYLFCSHPSHFLIQIFIQIFLAFSLHVLIHTLHTPSPPHTSSLITNESFGGCSGLDCGIRRELTTIWTTDIASFRPFG